MILALFYCFIALFCAGVAADCNPLAPTDSTNGCAAIPGLAASSYYIDFTQIKSLPKDWIIADASNITYGSNGVEFNFNKRKEAPYIWTNFYVAYGRIDVNMQVALGAGLVTSAVMMSDDADEIDWEFSGSNFGKGSNTGKVQTNVFGKGMTGSYRGSENDVKGAPQTSFHTYTLDWTPDKLDWILDGVIVHTENNNRLKTGNYQYPQTPSRLHVGMWDAGDPDTAPGTRNWATGSYTGVFTNYTQTPYVAYLKWVRITTPYPCKAWKYPSNFAGSWSEVTCTNETLPVSTSATPTTVAIAPKSTEAEYTVVAHDDGYLIADKIGCTFDQLKTSNPGLDWDKLNIGQTLKNPNAATSASTVSAPTSAGTSSVASTSSTSITPKNTDAEYTVVVGDNGYLIADKIGCTFDQLNATNPNIDWDKIDIGQKLKNPNAAVLTGKTSTGTIPANTTAVSTASTASAPKNTNAEYTVVAGDNGYIIADKLGSTFDQLNATNPGLDWDRIDIGQKLKNPNVASQASASSLLSSLVSSNSTSSLLTTSSSAASAAAGNGTTSPFVITSSFMISTNKSSNATGSTTIFSATKNSTSNSSITTTAIIITSASTTSTSNSNNTGYPTLITSNFTALVTTSSASIITTRTCVTDDCLNSMLATDFSASASSYCTQSSPGVVNPLVNVTGCSRNWRHIMSACSCLRSDFTAWLPLNPLMITASMTRSSTTTGSTTTTSTTTPLPTTSFTVSQSIPVRRPLLIISNSSASITSIIITTTSSTTTSSTTTSSTTVTPSKSTGSTSAPGSGGRTRGPLDLSGWTLFSKRKDNRRESRRGEERHHRSDGLQYGEAYDDQEEA